MARIVEVQITQELLQMICTTGWKVPFDSSVECVSGLPEGAEMVASRYDAKMNIAILVFEHDTFDEIEPGDPVPVLRIEHDLHYAR